MADPWKPGAWQPGAWQPGSWDYGGGGDITATLDLVEEGDTLVCTGTAAQPWRPVRRAPVVGGGGFVPRRVSKAWLRNLVQSPFTFHHQQSIEPFARLAQAKLQEDDDVCAAAAVVGARVRALRDEELLRRMAA